MLTGSLLLMAALAAVFAALMIATDNLRESEEQRSRSERLIATANRTEKLLLDLQTGQRGFVIAGHPAFLEPWLRARREFFPEADALVALTRGRPGQQARAVRIERDARAYLRWTESVIGIARENRGRARALVATGGGKRQVDALRAQFAAMIAAEQRLAAHRTRQAQRAGNQVEIVSAVGFGIVAMLLLARGLYLTRAVARPVSRVAGAARRVAAGDFAARVPVDGPGEVGELGRSFNSMAASLERSREEADLHNRQLRKSRAEAERARGQAQAARLEAERANEAKSEFLSRMSHELRTPLNAIIGFGQLLEMKPLPDDERESVAHILRGGRQLLELINEVLDISRIEAGELGLSIEAVLVDDLIADALSLLRPIAEEHGIRLHTDVELGERYVLADRQRLQQVLLNLLSNAIKYNRRGGRVTVSVEPVEDGKLRIGVRDEGEGIPQDKLERLFVPFDRLGAESRPIEGTGLGLALSRRLVELMGGRISVDSTMGEGTTFAVDLPLASSPGVISADFSSRPDAVEGIAELPPSKILHIEDNRANVLLLQQILGSNPDVRVMSAIQGTIGLDLARHHRPDLILLDLHLPDMSGEEVLRCLQEDPVTRELAVVVFSADAGPGQAARLLDAGACDYLTKPLDLPRFIAVMREVLDRGGGEVGRAPVSDPVGG